MESFHFCRYENHCVNPKALGFQSISINIYLYGQYPLSQNSFISSLDFDLLSEQARGDSSEEKLPEKENAGSGGWGGVWVKFEQTFFQNLACYCA